MVAKMMYFLAVIIFPLLAQFEVLSCSRDLRHDPSFKKEVEDFAEFLKEKKEKEAVSRRSIYLEQPLATSDKEPGRRHYSAEDGQGSLNSGIFESVIDELSHNVPHSGKHPPKHDISSRESLDSLRSSGEVRSALPLEKHHPVEEILYIRRSDSELGDPVPDVLDKLIHEDPTKDEIPQADQRDTDDQSNKLVDNEPSSDDACLTDNFTSHLHETCTDGPEYEMQFHPTFSKTIRQDMEKMLPEKDPNDNKCDYGKDITKEAGVEDRALCPFEWSISNRNPSRIPEYLYEAKCSCQVSRKIRGKRFECKEVKRVIPVLWISGCGPEGKKMYKQGWEEIAVACAPLEEKDSIVIPNTGESV